MEVQRIKTEGPRINRLRNVERLWIEVEAVGNGCSIETHKVLGVARNDDGTFRFQPTRIEIYADRLNAVLGRTRTEKERRAHEMACDLARNQIEEWIRENQKRVDKILVKEERERMIDLECNIRPEHHYKALGYPTGLPPITTCKVIHPHTYDTIDAFEFAKLSPEKKREWLVGAPVTPENAAVQANEHLAQTIAKAIAAGQQGKQQK